jgi:hypothetical protein
MFSCYSDHVIGETFTVQIGSSFLWGVTITLGPRLDCLDEPSPSVRRQFAGKHRLKLTYTRLPLLL